MIAPFTLALTLALAPPEAGVPLNHPVPARVAGRQFTQALERTLSASWENIELRPILNRLANEREISLLLDRRINPNQPLTLDFNYQPLRVGLSVIAQTVSAKLCTLGHVVYIGPPDRVDKLRTLEQLRANEAFQREDRLPRGRVLELSRRETVHWNDLDEPRQIVVDLARRAGIEVVNPEAVPHDLWASATLPEASLTEALSLLLIQFDLTFEWNADTTQVRLVPIPKEVALEKTYQPAGGSKTATRTARARFLLNVAERWEAQLPGLAAAVDVENHQITVRGTLEQHESLANLDRSKSKPKTSNTTEKKPPAIRDRQFTLRIENVRASDLIKKLEESGIQFRYDNEQLKAKGIDLDQLISLDVVKADADKFFHALCDPLGVTFAIDDLSITLSPEKHQ